MALRFRRDKTSPKPAREPAKVFVHRKFQLTLLTANALVIMLVCGFVAFQIHLNLAHINPHQARTVYGILASGCIAAFVLSSMIILMVSQRMLAEILSKEDTGSGTESRQTNLRRVA